VTFSKEMKVFSGSASRELAERMCNSIGMSLGKATVGCFSDGEVKIQLDENVRGCDVFILNSTSPPANDHLMELLMLIDAAKRASARRVTAVLPYFGYARQDRKDRPRVPITAKLVSNLIVAARASRVLTVDLHCGQIQGFFDIPLDHLSGDIVFAEYFQQQGTDNLVVVSPDTGSVHRVREFARRLDAPLVIVDKRRPKENQSEVMNVIGNVEGKRALIFDDMIDTGGTLVKAAKAVKDLGALDVRACVTHAVLSGMAVDLIAESVLGEIIVSDSIQLSARAAACPKIKVLSLAALVGEAVRRIHEEESISSLFK
jgi:ribose-phosphate pyrophosphokinase